MCIDWGDFSNLVPIFDSSETDQCFVLENISEGLHTILLGQPTQELVFHWWYVTYVNRLNIHLSSTYGHFQIWSDFFLNIACRHFLKYKCHEVMCLVLFLVRHNMDCFTKHQLFILFIAERKSGFKYKARREESVSHNFSTHFVWIRSKDTVNCVSKWIRQHQAISS